MKLQGFISEICIDAHGIDVGIFALFYKIIGIFRFCFKITLLS